MLTESQKEVISRASFNDLKNLRYHIEREIENREKDVVRFIIVEDTVCNAGVYLEEHFNYALEHYKKLLSENECLDYDDWKEGHHADMSAMKAPLEEFKQYLHLNSKEVNSQLGYNKL